ncbi:MAG: hypothetical protein EPO26_08905 [Chloroflexota bacterium]|nr:MAG: hypothetical protein EPO26_08905 [Chloroflexota bacterium]
MIRFPLVVALVLGAVSCAGPGAARGVTTGNAPPSVAKPNGPYIPNGEADGSSGKLVVSMTDQMRFTPNSMARVKTGQTIEIAVKNTGVTIHNVIAPALGVEKAIRVDPGKTGPVKLTAPSAVGTYQFWCNEPGHAEAGMIGQIIVE